MTRTHEQMRFLEPADRASEVCAVDREDLKLIPVHAPYPARNIGGLSVPGSRVRVLVFRQTRLVLWKTRNWAKRNPRVTCSGCAKAGEQITEHRHAYEHAGNTV